VPVKFLAHRIFTKGQKPICPLHSSVYHSPQGQYAIYLELPAQDLLEPSIISNVQTQIDDYSPRLLQVAVIYAEIGNVP
jgi:hypothetical protein